MKLEGQTIIVTSNEPWGPIWFSKQNYAYELSKKNRVIFLNQPPKWKLSHLFDRGLKKGVYNENLEFYDYNNYFPHINNFFNKLNNKLISKYWKDFLNEKGVKDYILWAFDPIRLYNHKELGAKLGIYHCVDYYYFKYLGETELCKNSDLHFATSQLYLDNFVKFGKPRYLVPHGISSEEFSISQSEMDKFDLPFKDYGLYIGVIDYRMDYKWLEDCILRFPNEKFVFIGPVRIPENSIIGKRIFEEKKYKNVFIAGPRHFKELKVYVKNSKFCISFMDITNHSNTVHHHKTLVYLCQGKPLFGPIYESYRNLENIMYMNENQTVVLDMLENFLKNGENSEYVNNRIEYSKKYKFENILMDAEAIIEDFTIKHNIQ